VLMTPLLPFAHYACQAYAMTTPAGDRRVLRDPEMEGMFIDDIVLVAKGGFQAIIDDARLFGRDWGFRLADVKAPVRWWHGDADNIVPLREAQAAVLQDALALARGRPRRGHELPRHVEEAQAREDADPRPRGRRRGQPAQAGPHQARPHPLGHLPDMPRGPPCIRPGRLYRPLQGGSMP